jgi:hypothetical protein
MSQITPAGIIIFFTISLLFTSVVTSWVLLQAFGVSIAGLPFELPNGDATIDLSNTDDIEESGGAWTYTDGKKVSTATDSYIVSRKVNHLQGVYTNTYQIDNPNQLDYSVVLTRSPFRTQEIIVQSDGFRVVESTIGLSDIFGENTIYFYPYEGANQVTSANIKTKFDTNAMLTPDVQDNSVVDFYFNGNPLFSVYQTSVNGFNIQSQTITDVFYGGVGSKNNIGLGVSEFTTNSAGSTTSTFSDLWNFATVLFKLLGWGIDSQYLPVELNLLLIKTQEFAIGIGIIGLFWK